MSRTDVAHALLEWRAAERRLDQLNSVGAPPDAIREAAEVVADTRESYRLAADEVAATPAAVGR